jgi:hypothetical protein
MRTVAAASVPMVRLSHQAAIRHFSPSLVQQISAQTHHDCVREGKPLALAPGVQTAIGGVSLFHTVESG